MYPRASRVGLSVHLDPNGDPSGNSKPKRGFLPDMSDEELEASLRSLLAQNKGDYKRVAMVLKKDNAKLRDLNRKANEKVETLAELSKEDADLLAAAKKAKLTSETLGNLLTENKELKARSEEQAFSLLVDDASKVAKVNSKVLRDQLVLNKQHLEMREIHVEKLNDKKEKVVVLEKMPHVRPQGDANAPLTPLTTWIGTLDKAYQSALQAEGSPKKSEGSSSFTEFPDQPNGSKAPSQTRAVDNHVKAMYGTLPSIPGVVPPKPATQGA